MARLPKLGVKNGYWHSSAGGKSKYYGSASTVSYENALLEFQKHLTETETKTASRQKPFRKVNFSRFAFDPEITIERVRDLYLSWMIKHRAKTNWDNQARNLNRFLAFVEPNLKIADLTSEHIEAFKDESLSRGMDEFYVNRHLSHVRSMIARSLKMGWIDIVNPLSRVEFLRLTQKPLMEADLMTQEELSLLLAGARNSRYTDLADMILIFYNTGARTHELLSATVGDFQKMRKTLVLANHKRAKTMKEPRPRVIPLNQTAYNIILDRTAGRNASEPIFPSPEGDHYKTSDFDYRFSRVRDVVGVSNKRTPYSLRHLYISEALMAGIDPMTIARACGTSVMMIERVYGHFRVEALHQAQDKLDKMRAGQGASQPTILKVHA